MGRACLSTGRREYIQQLIGDLGVDGGMTLKYTDLADFVREF
jgi:hypothetical protein